jgi:hypothetical protein
LVSFFLAAASLSPSETGRRRLVAWNVGAAILVAAFGLYQAIGIPRRWPGTGLLLLPLQREYFRFQALGSSYVRPTSIFLEPSWYGGYLCWCGALALAAWGSAVGGFRFAWGALSLLLVIAMLSTVSLGVYADLTVLLVAFAAVAFRAHRLSLRALGRAMAILGVIVLGTALTPWGRALGSALAERYRNLEAVPEALRQPDSQLQESSWIRIRNVTLSFEMIGTRPLTGIGLGQFARYLTPERRNPRWIEQSWCGWLGIAAEMGLFGPLLLVGALLLVLGQPRGGGVASLAVPVLVAIAVIQQVHTGSFIDLWWWYPVSLAVVLAQRDLRPVAATSDSAVWSER